MGDTEQLIGLYHTGFMICLALTILFIALSIFLFFKLKIRDVFNILTGRAQKRSIRMMEEENAKTGKLRRDYVPTNTSSDLYTTPSGGIRLPSTSAQSGRRRKPSKARFMARKVACKIL